ncbi:MAG: LPS export ABC transporter periplasmic protein LptC [Deltaproteobacteria bacterium]|nr:LPS export ABC transporter periplasmic protein LptC [Deltaproteobacteria bacterium]
MRRIPVIMWPIAGIVVLLLIVAAFIITGPRLTQVSTTTPLVPGESLKMSEVQYDQDKEGGQGWELVAKEAHFFDTTQIVSLKDVLLTLDSTEDNSYTIRGNEGDYCRKSEEIVLKGSVVGTSKSGYQLETTQLTYKQKEESVVTEKPVKVIGPFFRVKGEGLYIDLKRNRFMVKRNVFTTITGGNVL